MQAVLDTKAGQVGSTIHLTPTMTKLGRPVIDKLPIEQLPTEERPKARRRAGNRASARRTKERKLEEQRQHALLVANLQATINRLERLYTIQLHLKDQQIAALMRDVEEERRRREEERHEFQHAILQHQLVIKQKEHQLYLREVPVKQEITI